MLACSRLLMSKDIDAATKIRLFGLRGRAALVLFDFVEAAEDFSEVIKAEPDNLSARAGRAEALSQHGEHAKAAADWERIVALKPEDLAAHLQLGASLNAAAAYDKAVVAFDEAVKRDPNNPESHVGLARAYDGAGNAEKADQSLAAALKINAGSISALHRAGGDRGKARRHETCDRKLPAGPQGQRHADQATSGAAAPRRRNAGSAALIAAGRRLRQGIFPPRLHRPLWRDFRRRELFFPWKTCA